jgi:hypothetical protein
VTEVRQGSRKVTCSTAASRTTMLSFAWSRPWARAKMSKCTPKSLRYFAITTYISRAKPLPLLALRASPCNAEAQHTAREGRLRLQIWV